MADARTPSHRTTRGDESARARRPENLPPVEPELRVPPPRPMVWRARAWSHGRIDRADLLRDGHAVRAWVVEAKWTDDAEGPDIRARFAFEAGDRLVHGRFAGSYDAIHLAAGFPDFSAWLGRAFVDGGTLTVLHPPGRPEEHRIYGTMELYVARDLSEVVTELSRAVDAAARTALLEEARGFLGPTVGIVFFSTPDSQRYGDRLRDAVARLTGTKTRTVSGRALLDAAMAALAEGRADAEAVRELDEICRVFAPGRWAAR